MIWSLISKTKLELLGVDEHECSAAIRASPLSSMARCAERARVASVKKLKQGLMKPNFENGFCLIVRVGLVVQQ